MQIEGAVVGHPHLPCKVGVSVRESRVELNSPSIALQSSIDVLHLLKSIAHVTVGIRKVRLDPGRGQI